MARASLAPAAITSLPSALLPLLGKAEMSIKAPDGAGPIIVPRSDLSARAAQALAAGLAGFLTIYPRSWHVRPV